MAAFILYYHRIYPEGPAPDVTLSLFEWQMRYLRERFTILSLDELFSYINGGMHLERPGVAITFDDGWFDNFVYAYPILKKYGLKATIFISTGKIRSEEYIRPTLEGYWRGGTIMDALQKPKNANMSLYPHSDDLGEFLTWEELRVMQGSGIFSVQSHGVEHRKVISGNDIIGFNNGKTGFRAIASDARIGVPLYPAKSALSTKIYYPDTQLNDHMASFVEKKGGEFFPLGRGWKEELMREASWFMGHSLSMGCWEEEDAMRRRIKAEFIESRDKIACETGIRPVHLCWPWGEYSNIGIELAKEAGYRACYTTRAGHITIGIDPYMIPRIRISGGKWSFIKRSMIYSNPLISKSYLLVTRRN